DILEVAYTVRYPNAVNAVTGIADIDGERKAEDRRKLLAIERLVLETISFNFTIQMAFPYIIKFARQLDTSKDLSRLAWRLCADSHRTVITLEYPPHSVALSCLYLAALLATFEAPPLSSPEEATKAQALVDLFSHAGEWESKYLANIEDLHVYSYLHRVLFLIATILLRRLLRPLLPILLHEHQIPSRTFPEVQPPQSKPCFSHPPTS
ncbi:hypothetical protein FRC16_005672, partial [Serendipita sp. 398]